MPHSRLNAWNPSLVAVCLHSCAIARSLKNKLFAQRNILLGENSSEALCCADLM